MKPITVDDVLNERLMFLGRGSSSVAWVNKDFTEVALRTYSDSRDYIDICKEILILAKKYDKTGLIPSVKRMYFDGESSIHTMAYYYGRKPVFQEPIYKSRLTDLDRVSAKIEAAYGSDCLEAMKAIKKATDLLGVTQRTVIDLRHDNIKAETMLVDPVVCLVPSRDMKSIIRGVDNEVSGSSWKNRISRAVGRWFGR